MRGLIAACVRRPIATLMGFLGLLILGVIAASGMGIELLPDVRLPRLVVTAAFPGMPASDVRVLLAIPLEDALCSLRGVKRTASVSRDGAAAVTLDYQWGTDVQAAAVDARERIDTVYPSLPSQAARPRVLAADPGGGDVLVAAVFPRSGDLAFARRLAEREIRTRLQQVAGVGTVSVVGGEHEEVQVLVDQEKAAARGAAMSDIASALADWNVDLPAGSIIEGSSELLVRTEGSVKDLAALGNLRVPGGSGGFALREVADIRRALRDRTSMFQVDGRECVGLRVGRRAGVSPVAVSRAARAELRRLAEAYGRDLELRLVRDSAAFVARSVSDLALSALAGTAIAFLVVLLFVRDAATSFILVSTVPLSIVAALLLLRAAGRTLNVMSMGGLSMGIGMMMDNSVVILENLARRVAPGRGLPCTSETVVQAVLEMSGSNTGATVTSIVVFLPVIFLPGAVGAVFTDLALAVIFSQVISWVVSITLIPAVFRLAGGSRRTRWPSRPGAHGPQLTERLEGRFRAALRFLFRRPLVLAALLAVTTAAGVASLRSLRVEFLPAVDTGEVAVTVALPAGSTIEAAAVEGQALARRIAAVDGVAMIHARAGGEEDDPVYLADPSGSAGVLHVTAVLAGGRRPRAAQIAAGMREALAGRIGRAAVELPGAAISPLLGLSGSRTEIRVRGDDQEQALDRARELMRALEEGGAGQDAEVFPSARAPQLRIVPDRQAAARAGVDVAAVAWTVRSALDGVVPTRIDLDGKEQDVRVRVAAGSPPGAVSVGEIRIRSPGGDFLRVSDIAAVTETESPAALLRADRADAASVFFSPASGPRGTADGTIRRILAARPYALSVGDSALRESMSPLLVTFALVLVLLYLVLGAQFESFVLPFFLLASLPLSFFGIFAALFLAGKTLNADSLLGIIVLFGIAVNNTIVLYETYAQRHARSGPRNLLAAVYKGTAERLRPILITMLTTVTALVPVALDPTGTSTQSGMAVAIIGGLFVSTALTLFAAPMMFFRWLGRRGRAA
jgi:multidrug efflux pump subunit AcrB